jgi:diguanylate cyclase (GGDEF)-like protein
LAAFEVITEADGRESWVLTTKLPLRDHQGNIVGTMGISRDIIDRKRVERELHEDQVRLEELVARRTAELVHANELLEQDIAVRKVAEQQLAVKAQELARSNELLENLSLIDDLTGLYNRKGFFALAEHRAKLACRTADPFSVAFVDLDGLKHINDAFGHQAGNRALVDAASVLRDSFRQSDILARLGGDEFAAFVVEADETKIARILGRIQQNLDGCNAAPDRHYRLSFSIGIVSSSSAKDSNIETLLGRADALMYEQKRNKG